MSGFAESVAEEAVEPGADWAVTSVPPMATVTLESVQGPGEWEANGHRVQQRLFTVIVSYRHRA